MTSDLKATVKHSFVYSAANILKKVAGFFMIPIYTRYLTPADYGILELLELTLSVIVILAGMRIGQALIRFYHHYDDPKDKNEVFTTAFLSVVIITVFVIVVLQCFTTPISRFIFGPEADTTFLKIGFFCLGFQLIYLVPEDYLLARKKSITYSSISIFCLIISLSLNIYFIVWLKLGVLGILYSMFITKLLNLFLAYLVTLPHRAFCFSMAKLRQMVKFAMPLIPATLALFILHFSDRYFLQRFSNLTEVGIYSLAYKFGMLISLLISQAFFQIWNTQRYEILQRPDSQYIYTRVFSYYLFALVSGAFALSLFSDELIRLMSPPPFHRASAIVPLILLSYIFYGVGQFFSLGMMITYRTGYFALIQVATAAFCVGSNYFFIKHYGIIGAAVSTNLCFLFLALASFFVSQRLFYVKIEYRRIFLFSFVLFSCYFMSLFGQFSLLVGFLWKSTLIFLAAVTLIFIGFFEENELSLVKAYFARFLLRT